MSEYEVPFPTIKVEETKSNNDMEEPTKENQATNQLIQPTNNVNLDQKVKEVINKYVARRVKEVNMVWGEGLRCWKLEMIGCWDIGWEEKLMKHRGWFTELKNRYFINSLYLLIQDKI